MNERQHQIIHTLGAEPTISSSQEIEARTVFLADYLAKTRLHGFVLGISGGQDSLLAGTLAQRAVQRQRENGGDAEFHAVLLPYGSQLDRNDALLSCDFIQPDVVHDIDIKPSVDSITETISLDETTPLSDFDKGNIKARMRMIAQYAIAGSHGLLVIGTDHAAEAVTGFFTKYGDGGADILPLSGLTKRQGRQLLRTLGTPEHLIIKPPTADLLDSKPGQTDEQELGIDYESLDNYLEGRPVDTRIAAQIEQRYDATRHKRELPAAYSRHLPE